MSTDETRERFRDMRNANTAALFMLREQVDELQGLLSSLDTEETWGMVGILMRTATLYALDQVDGDQALAEKLLERVILHAARHEAEVTA